MGLKTLLASIVVAMAFLISLNLLSNNTVSPASNFLSIESEEQKAFLNFIAKYGRSYSSKEEFPLRFHNFAINYRKVALHNAKPGVSFTMEVNQFSDLDQAEM